MTSRPSTGADRPVRRYPMLDALDGQTGEGACDFYSSMARDDRGTYHLNVQHEDGCLVHDEGPSR